MDSNFTFSDYVAKVMNKAYNREDINDTPAVSDDSGPSREMFNADPKKWTAKIIDGEKMLFFNNRFLNITKLKDALQKVYNDNGYPHYGFSKLGESELVRYKTLRDILMNEFLDDMGEDELDPEETAQTIFDNEAKDFNWKPEQLTM
jgi:hypothetical protein